MLDRDPENSGPRLRRNRRGWRQAARPPSDLSDLKNKIVTGEVVLGGQLQRVAEFALSNPEIIAFQSAANVALAAGVSHTRAWQLARTFAFRNYRDFRRLFQQHLAGRVP